MSGRKLFPVALLVVVVTSSARAMADDKVLHEEKSTYNNIIVTEDDRGLRTLWFEKGGSRQSVVQVGDPNHVELPYARVMPVGLAFVVQPRRVLIVGLGGGTIPTFMHHHFPRMTVDVVDIDAKVVEVAKEYFGFQEDTTLRVHVDDGRRFIENCRNPYDIIFLDAFSSDSIPYHLSTQEFLQSVRAAIAPTGVVVANIWSRRSNQLYDSMVRTYEDVFGDVYILDVRRVNNKILIAAATDRQIERDSLARRCRDISRDNHFPFDMGEFVKYSFRQPEIEGCNGRVLKDADQNAGRP